MQVPVLIYIVAERACRSPLSLRLGSFDEDLYLSSEAQRVHTFNEGDDEAFLALDEIAMHAHNQAPANMKYDLGDNVIEG
jgi:hypothetical protein